MERIYQLALVIHIFSAIVLVGSMFFNVAILTPALNRIPPAQSAAVADKVGAGLRIAGPASLVLLGLTGFLRLSDLGIMGDLFTLGFLTDNWKLAVPLWLMFLSWFVLVITGTLSAIWYEKVLAKKLPYSAGLRDLEVRRAAQERISAYQERLNLVNTTLGALAALGGALFASGLLN
ncbi:MAG TPA: hypothetical protein VGL92_10525 [Acidimicrobiia bacterium]